MVGLEIWLNIGGDIEEAPMKNGSMHIKEVKNMFMQLFGRPYDQKKMMSERNTY